jgi:hypothetical protein
MNSFVAWIWLFLILPSIGKIKQFIIDNPERVYLQSDKNDCLSGDKIWWRGYITAGRFPGAFSTVLYVNLYNDSAKLVLRQKCVILKGINEGQITIPDNLESGVYWLRAATALEYILDSTKGFRIPINIYDPAEYDKFPHYSFVGALPDTALNYDPGITLSSNPTTYGVVCDIRTNNLFKRWDRPLRLELRAANQDPTFLSLTLSLQKERERIRIPLPGVYGYLHISLLDADTILSDEIINIEYPVDGTD